MLKLISFNALLLLVFLGCKYEPLEPIPEFYTIKYEIKGTAKTVRTRHINAWGYLELRSFTSLPWTYEFQYKRPTGTYVMVSAQSHVITDTVMVIIYRDNVVFLSDTSFGDNAVATVSGRL